MLILIRTKIDARWRPRLARRPPIFGETGHPQLVQSRPGKRVEARHLFGTEQKGGATLGTVYVVNDKKLSASCCP